MINQEFGNIIYLEEIRTNPHLTTITTSNKDQ